MRVWGGFTPSRGRVPRENDAVRSVECPPSSCRVTTPARAFYRRVRCCYMMSFSFFTYAHTHKRHTRCREEIINKSCHARAESPLGAAHKGFPPRIGYRRTRVHYPVRRKTLKDFMARKRAVSRKLDDVVIVAGLFCFVLQFRFFPNGDHPGGTARKRRVSPTHPGRSLALTARSPPAAPRTCVHR